MLKVIDAKNKNGWTRELKEVQQFDFLSFV